MSVSKDLVNIIKGSDDKGTKAYDTSATVTRVEGSTAWVHIPGGVDETPVKKTINAKEGDVVQVRVSGGSAWLNGNASAPPTDDTVAIQADETATVAAMAADSAVQYANDAQKSAASAQASATTAYNAAQAAQTSANNALTSAQNASEYAARALGNLSTVQSVSETLTWITQHGTMALTTDVALDPTHVYFVVDPAGDYTVNGTTYAIVTEPDVADIGTYYELSIDESLNNYVGTHLALTSEGLWLLPASSGTNKVLVATGAGSIYTTAGTYILDSSGGTVASFRANGATIGEVLNGQTRTEIGTNGMQIVYRKTGSDIEIANLGYGPGIDSGGGTSNDPYYTLGRRNTGSTVGNYSVAEGINSVASGYASHAEGWSIRDENDETVPTSATGQASHAEGLATLASGNYSHSEGAQTTASGLNSHAEGAKCVASGSHSHAQNNGTVADQASQTAIGDFNTKNNTNNLFVIGNGIGDNYRSDAFTVDKNGNVNIASGAKYKINGTNLSASDVGALSSSTTYVSGVKGDSESSYRSGNVNLTSANIGAVALADKYTRSSAGDLAWTNQTDGDAKVIAKSALAFWNGAYSGNGSNLSKCASGTIIGSNGGTMTGQLLTSFKTSVAMGSYGSAQTTVGGLVGEVRYSSGCSGSASIGTAYTANGVTIATGWYNFSYMPHRSGGANGSASGDNQDYGNLFLFGMNNTNGRFIVRVSSGSIAEVVKIVTSKELQTGSIAGTSVGANTYVDVGVTFSPTMKSTPNVIVGLRSDSTAGAIGSISVAVLTGSVSTTGFTCRIFNAGSATRAPGANWIAME